MTRRIAILWDNFGPLHIDRCNAVARHFTKSLEVIGIEVFAGSSIYDWQQPEADEFRKVTLFQAGSWAEISSLRIANAVVNAVRSNKCEAAFLCHYDQAAMLVVAARLRLAYPSTDQALRPMVWRFRRERSRSRREDIG